MSFNGKDYTAWREQRFNAVFEYFGKKDIFKNQVILELGSGSGEITKFLLQNKAKEVFAIEGRKDHHESAVKEGLPSYLFDLNNPPDDLLKEELSKRNWDIILCWGLIYHLSDPLECLRRFCFDQMSYDTMLLLETEVVDSSDPNFMIPENENLGQFDDGISKQGFRPSYASIEKIFQDNELDFDKINVKDYSGSPHRYMWEETNDQKHQRNNRRRMWAAWTKSTF